MADGRERIESIAPDLAVLKVGNQSRQVQICYRATTSGSIDPVQTISVPQQVTVKPANLLTALLVWQDATVTNSPELFDRIERILRSRDTVVPDTLT